MIAFPVRVMIDQLSVTLKLEFVLIVNTELKVIRVNAVKPMYKNQIVVDVPLVTMVTMITALLDAKVC